VSSGLTSAEDSAEQAKNPHLQAIMKTVFWPTAWLVRRDSNPEDWGLANLVKHLHHWCLALDLSVAEQAN
jgi:hypothetical protein